MATILTADIGGTNCRLGLFSLEYGNLDMTRLACVHTGDVPHAEALLQAFEKELETHPHKVDAVVIAIAGPVENATRGKLSNGSLEIDFTDLNKNEMKFFLLNDFIAQAYAVLSPEGERAAHIYGPEKPLNDGVRSVIGAGTGLGQALVRRITAPIWGHAAKWIALPSENGHAVFPFIGKKEEEFQEFLCAELKTPYATGDQALTGRGLSCLHLFLTGKRLTPAEIGAEALGSQTDTLDWYARLYARACRNWMLCTLCEGGLWIAGGIAAKNRLVVTCESFEKELYFSPQWEGLLRSIPVHLMEDTNSGLWGAGRFGQQQLEVA